MCFFLISDLTSVHGHMVECLVCYITIITNCDRSQQQMLSESCVVYSPFEEFHQQADIE